MPSVYESIELKSLICPASSAQSIKVYIYLDDAEWVSYDIILNNTPQKDLNNLGIVQNRVSLGSIVALEVDEIPLDQVSLELKSGTLDYPTADGTYSLTYTCYP